MSVAEILAYIEGVTAVAAGIPTPIQPELVLALGIEKIAASAIGAIAAAKKQTVEQVVAQLHQITPVQ